MYRCAAFTACLRWSASALSSLFSSSSCRCLSACRHEPCCCVLCRRCLCQLVTETQLQHCVASSLQVAAGRWCELLTNVASGSGACAPFVLPASCWRPCPAAALASTSCCMSCAWTCCQSSLCRQFRASAAPSREGGRLEAASKQRNKHRAKSNVLLLLLLLLLPEAAAASCDWTNAGPPDQRTAAAQLPQRAPQLLSAGFRAQSARQWRHCRAPGHLQGRQIVTALRC